MHLPVNYGHSSVIADDVDWQMLDIFGPGQVDKGRIVDLWGTSIAFISEG
jgi:hypothetical protein